MCKKQPTRTKPQLEFGVLELGVWNLGFGIWGIGIWSLGFGIGCLGFGVWVLDQFFHLFPCWGFVLFTHWGFVRWGIVMQPLNMSMLRVDFGLTDFLMLILYLCFYTGILQPISFYMQDMHLQMSWFSLL